MKGHTIDKCYKIIGFPKDFKFRNDPLNKNSANNSICDSIIPDTKAQTQFSHDQVAKLLSLIGDKFVVEEASANMAANMAGTLVC